jgi:hypothetical protein
MFINFRQSVFILLSLIILSSLSSTNLLSIGKVYSQDTVLNENNPIILPSPTACVFDDGESPQDIEDEECFIIQSGQETGGADNIFFTLRSDESVDEFRCELRDENNILIRPPIVTENPSNCLVDPNNIEQTYNNLPDGTYQFTVFANIFVETTTNNNNNNNDVTQQIERTGKSPTFTFIVGTGGAGAGGGAGFLDSGGTNVFINSKIGTNYIPDDLLEIVINKGKAEFSNVEYLLKNNIKANTTSLECFEVSDGSDSDERYPGFNKINCINLFIIAEQPSLKNSDSNSTTYNITSEFSYMNIYTLKYAISNGINGNSATCIIAIDERHDPIPPRIGDLGLQLRSCEDFFIVY